MGVKVLTKSEVFATHGVELTRFATSLVGPADAQDVVSDALMRTLWSDGWDDVANQRAYLQMLRWPMMGAGITIDHSVFA